MAIRPGRSLLVQLRHWLSTAEVPDSGGVVMVPAMLMYLSMPAVVAKGTSVAVIIPTSIIGTLRNRKNENVDLRASAILGFSGIATAVVGGWASSRMDDTLDRKSTRLNSSH